MQTKICTKCKQEKTLDNYSTNYSKNSYMSTPDNKYKKVCNACCNAYAKQWRDSKGKNGYKSKSKKITKYGKEERLLISAIRRKLSAAKRRITKYNQTPTNLDTTYLYDMYKEQKGRCRYCNEGLTLIKKHPGNLSLDKIDPEKGYVKGNVQWLAWAVNRAKGDLPEEMFLSMCKAITTKCNDYSERKYTISD